MPKKRSCLACETVRHDMLASGRFDHVRGCRRTTQVNEAVRVRGRQDAHKALSYQWHEVVARVS